MTYSAVKDSLNPWFGKPLHKLPRNLQGIANAYIPKWATLSPTERRTRAEEVDRQRALKVDLEFRKYFRETDQAGDDPILVAEGVIGWWDFTMAADFWLKRFSITPLEAAMLLCQLNPLDNIADPEAHSNGETGPEEYKKLLRAFEDADRSAPGDRTLAQWRLAAESNGLKIHSWIDEYAKAGTVLHAPSSGSGTSTLRKPVAVAVPHSTNSGVKNKLRSHSLDVPIKKAMDEAKSRDMTAVYLKLKELALKGEAPFTGMFEGENLCYTKDNNTSARLTKNALGKRIKNL